MIFEVLSSESTADALHSDQVQSLADALGSRRSLLVTSGEQRQSRPPNTSVLEHCNPNTILLKASWSIFHPVMDAVQAQCSWYLGRASSSRRPLR